METLKIAFLSYMGLYSTPPVNYGGEIIQWNLADELSKLGHEVTLYASPGSKKPVNGKLIEHASLDPDKNLMAHIEHNFVLQQMNSILKHDFLIDSSNFKYAHYYADIHHQSQKAIAHMISNDFYNLKQPYHVVCLSWKHTKLAETSSPAYSKEPLPHPVFHNYNYLINVSNPMYVYPDIDLEEYQPRYDKEDYVCWTSRMSGEKGIVRAIESCQKAGIKLKISGSRWAPDHKRYYEKVVEPLLQKYSIEYVETDTRAKLIDFLQRARAFIFPVDYPESFGYVVLESLACGTPVITTPNGAMPEIVEHKKSGYIVPNSDECFVRALKRIHRIKPIECRERAKRFAKGNGAKDMNYLIKKSLDGDWKCLDLPFLLR